MRDRKADHTGLLIGAVLLMLIGWIGLIWLVTNTLPRIGGELWMFFVMLQLAVTGTAIPVVRYLNVRFTPANKPVPTSGVIIRQSIWVGLFVVACAWLLIPRALTLPIMFIIVIVFVVLELFLLLRQPSSGTSR